MRAARGFTLIELLVVLVIIGSLLSLTLLSSGGPSYSRELRDEAERLASVITVLSDEAVMNGAEYGLRVDSEGYEVLVYDYLAGDWNPPSPPKTYGLPVWARLSLQLDGEPLVLPAPTMQGEEAHRWATDEPRKKPKPTPQVLVLSSGEFTPFLLRVELREGGAAYRVQSDGYQLPRAELAE